MTCLLLWLAGLLVQSPPNPDPAVRLLEFALQGNTQTARQCLQVLAGKIREGELEPERLETMRPRLDALLADKLADRQHPLHFDSAALAGCWGNSGALESLRQVVQDEHRSAADRLAALDTLRVGNPEEFLRAARPILAASAAHPELAGQVLAALGRVADEQVAHTVLDVYPELPAALRPKAIEVLVQRPAWSRLLLVAIEKQSIPASAVHVNQVRTLLASRDQELSQRAGRIWGQVRADRNPQREAVIAQVRQLLVSQPGDASRGEAVFHKICGQCHTIHGKGQEVGPDITVNGRNSYEQLLSNVLDPNLVIGAAYQGRTVVTVDGRVLNGLLVEDSPRRLVLKLQGGKLESLPREDIDEVSVSPLSLMPEGLETQLTEQELVDLFAFLVLDKPPSDPAAVRIPGAPPERSPQ